MNSNLTICVGVVALCKLASVSKIREMCVGAFFKTKHSLDLGYTGIDTRYNTHVTSFMLTTNNSCHLERV